MPPALDKLIEKGLSNNPRGRQQSTDEYLAELDQAMAVVAPTKPLPPEPAPLPPLALKPAPGPISIGGVQLSPFMLGGIGVAVVAAILVAMMMGNGSNGDSSHDTQDGFETATDDPPAPTPEPLPPPPPPSPPTPPPPPPVAVGFEALSGFWTDDYGNYFDVAVSANGAVSGRAQQGPIAGYSLAGQFSGDQFQFQIGNQFGPVSGSYGLRTDACHVQYQAVDALGQPLTAMLHINHLPGQPCP